MNIDTNISTPKSCARFSALWAHNGLEAIQLLRSEHPMSLKEAKDLIVPAWENHRNFGWNYTPIGGNPGHQYSPQLGKCACKAKEGRKK